MNRAAVMIESGDITADAVSKTTAAAVMRIVATKISTAAAAVNESGVGVTTAATAAAVAVFGVAAILASAAVARTTAGVGGMDSAASIMTVFVVVHQADCCCYSGDCSWMGGGTPCPSSVERGNGCVELTESLETIGGCCDVCRTRYGCDERRLGGIEW